jgi:uncharacterized secreted protein with C-terminal beta-propeller domain
MSRKVGIFILGTFFLVCFCGQVSSQVDIHFLTQEEGQVAILDETYEPYFSQLQRREIAAFVQEFPPLGSLESARVFAREKFSAAVSDFTEMEKACIGFVINVITSKFNEQGNELYASHPWKLIKIEDWLCGGFAHTRGDYIILSQKHIDHLSSDWSDNMTSAEEENLIVKLGGLLVHEQMHSLQRSYKHDFASFYRDIWGYVEGEVTADTSISLNQVSNPDAPVANWLISGESEELYWIRTLLKPTDSIPQMGKDFINVVFLVEKTMDSTYELQRLENGTLRTVEMEDLESFTSSFPKVAMRGIDHPNEVSAYMMSEYFQAVFRNREPFREASEEAQAKIDSFIAWIKNYMHNHTKTKK